MFVSPYLLLFSPDRVQGSYLSPRVINLLLQYVTQAVAYSHTWKALKPHAEQILLRWVLQGYAHWPPTHDYVVSWSE